MNAPLLAIDGLSAALTGRRHDLLRDVSLDVTAGEVHGLLGESGAGKSTIAKAVLGLLPRPIGRFVIGLTTHWWGRPLHFDRRLPGGKDPSRDKAT